MDYILRKNPFTRHCTKHWIR